jgi:glutamine amidotransferase
MCRLYGFHANEPTKVECTLVRAQNALMVQSRQDRRGCSHSDGWGIAVFEDSVPEIERRDTAAWQDLHFSVTAERVFARTVVAHVRDATVGGPSLVNTHPFHHGRWVFAHNGTVRGFDRVAVGLAEETAPELLDERLGSTDSELSFLWLLSRLRAAHVDLESREVDIESAVRVLADSVRELARRSRAERTGRQERLNFLLTDGRWLLVSRWHNDLYWVRRDGIHDCEICGIPHIRHQAGTGYRAVVVASEPISHEEWEEVPEGSILVVAPDVEARVWPI